MFESIYIGILIILLIMSAVFIRKSIYSYINIFLIAGIVFLLTKQNTFFIYTFLFGSIFVFNIISTGSLVRHEGFHYTRFVAPALSGFILISTILLKILSSNNIIYSFVYSLYSYFIAIILSITILGLIAAKQRPKYDKDFIIILGCSISRQGGLLPLLRGRANKAIRYAWDQEIATGKSVKFVPSGGQGKNEIMSEGSAITLYLESHGAEDYEIITEKKSRNTYENFLFSRKLILDANPSANVAFSTTGYHVFRSGLLAKKAGFKNIQAVSSNTTWYFWPNGFARETIGVLALTYKLQLAFGLIFALLYTLLSRTI